MNRVTDPAADTATDRTADPAIDPATGAATGTATGRVAGTVTGPVPDPVTGSVPDLPADRVAGGPTGAPVPAPAPGRRDLPGRPCSVAAGLALVGERWAALAVREIALGNRRFGAIARNTGAPRDVLTARLRMLEAEGLVERRPYQERPARFEYHLTDAGRDLRPLLLVIAAWADRWLDGDPPVRYHHQDHRLEVALVCRTCGAEVDPDDVHLHFEAATGWTVAGPAAEES